MPKEIAPGDIAKSKANWLGQWNDSASKPTVLPRSKSQRLALQAKLANVDAENAIARAYQMELARTKVVGEAMFKSGKALRYSLTSAIRSLFLRTEVARRQIEPGYRPKE
tara:strand:- start:253 stop:582 length:330 start_codon:yes stop_codon:yes gene_type:complete